MSKETRQGRGRDFARKFEHGPKDKVLGSADFASGKDALTFERERETHTHIHDIGRRAQMAELLDTGASPIKRLGDLMRDEYRAALALVLEHGPVEAKEARAGARYLSGVKRQAEQDYWEQLTSRWGPYVVYLATDGTMLLDRRGGDR